MRVRGLGRKCRASGGSIFEDSKIGLLIVNFDRLAQRLIVSVVDQDLIVSGHNCIPIGPFGVAGCGYTSGQFYVC